MLSFFESPIGCIHVSGKDSLDFFNRMSTNDLAALPTGEYKKTVFTNDKGRIIDIVTLINWNDGMLMLTSPGYEDKIIEHLDKYIIMDDVALTKQTGYGSLNFFGADVIQTVNNILNSGIDTNNRISDIAGVTAYFDDFAFGKVILIGVKEKLSEIKQKFSEFQELSESEYNLFRIEHGFPVAPNEINEQINPVECGLNKYISYTKGCYIGQEVIARLDSQGKIPKQMVKISSDSAISPDDKIYTDEKETGFISSAAKEHENEYKGLGFIRSVNLDFESDYISRNENGETNIKISKAI